MICGRGLQYGVFTLVLLFDVLYLVYFNKENMAGDNKYNDVENFLIGQMVISLIGILSLILSYGNRQLLYTTILLEAGLMAISIYILTFLSDLPAPKEHLKLVAFAYMATLVGAIGGFLGISSCLLMMNRRC